MIEALGHFLRDGAREIKAARNACHAEQDVPDVGDHPAADHHVVGKNAEGAQKPRVAEDLPKRIGRAARYAVGENEGVHAVGLGAAADHVFNEDDRDAHEQHHGNEGQHIGAAAV